MAVGASLDIGAEIAAGTGARAGVANTPAGLPGLTPQAESKSGSAVDLAHPEAADSQGWDTLWSRLIAGAESEALVPHAQQSRASMEISGAALTADEMTTTPVQADIRAAARQHLSELNPSIAGQAAIPQRPGQQSLEEASLEEGSTSPLDASNISMESSSRARTAESARRGRPAEKSAARSPAKNAFPVQSATQLPAVGAEAAPALPVPNPPPASLGLSPIVPRNPRPLGAVPLSDLSSTWVKTPLTGVFASESSGTALRKASSNASEGPTAPGEEQSTSEVPGGSLRANQLERSVPPQLAQSRSIEPQGAGVKPAAETSAVGGKATGTYGKVNGIGRGDASVAQDPSSPVTGQTAGGFHNAGPSCRSSSDGESQTGKPDRGISSLAWKTDIVRGPGVVPAQHSSEFAMPASVSSPGSGSSTSAPLAHQAAVQVAPAETFTALDVQADGRSPLWTHTGSQRAEAGFQDPALGWVGVRAETAGGSIHAVILPDSMQAAQVLGTHMQGLGPHLSDRHLPVETVSLQSGGTGNSGTGQGGGQQNPAQENVQQDSFGSTAGMAGAAQSARAPEAVTLIPQMPSGATISLMA